MKKQIDWPTIWPLVAACLAFGVVYALSLAGGAAVETVLLRSSGALLIVGLAGVIVRALIAAALAAPEGTRGQAIDVTLPAEEPEDAEGPAEPPVAA